MRLTIQSPQGTEADLRDIHAVRATLADSKPLTILPRHAPLMAELGDAPITAVHSNGEESFSPASGILLVADDTVKILAEGMKADEDDHA